MVACKWHRATLAGDAQISLRKDRVAKAVQLGGEEAVEEVALFGMDTMAAGGGEVVVVLVVAFVVAGSGRSSNGMGQIGAKFKTERIFVCFAEVAGIEWANWNGLICIFIKTPFSWG